MYIHKYTYNTSGLEYSQAGVGGLEGCRIQIVSDAGLTTPFDIRYQYLPIIALSRYPKLVIGERFCLGLKPSSTTLRPFLSSSAAQEAVYLS
jgi:hypothetical protein